MTLFINSLPYESNEYCDRFDEHQLKSYTYTKASDVVSKLK